MYLEIQLITGCRIQNNLDDQTTKWSPEPIIDQWHCKNSSETNFVIYPPLTILKLTIGRQTGGINWRRKYSAPVIHAGHESQRRQQMVSLLYRSKCLVLARKGGLLTSYCQGGNREAWPTYSWEYWKYQLFGGCEAWAGSAIIINIYTKMK